MSVTIALHAAPRLPDPKAASPSSTKTAGGGAFADLLSAAGHKDDEPSAKPQGEADDAVAPVADASLTTGLLALAQAVLQPAPVLKPVPAAATPATAAQSSTPARAGAASSGLTATQTPKSVPDLQPGVPRSEPQAAEASTTLPPRVPAPEGEFSATVATTLSATAAPTPLATVTGGAAAAPAAGATGTTRPTPATPRAASPARVASPVGEGDGAAVRGGSTSTVEAAPAPIAPDVSATTSGRAAASGRAGNQTSATDPRPDVPAAATAPRANTEGVPVLAAATVVPGSTPLLTTVAPVLAPTQPTAPDTVTTSRATAGSTPDPLRVSVSTAAVSGDATAAASPDASLTEALAHQGAGTSSGDQGSGGRDDGGRGAMAERAAPDMAAAAPVAAAAALDGAGSVAGTATQQVIAYLASTGVAANDPAVAGTADALAQTAATAADAATRATAVPSTVTLELNPANLGRVTVTLQMRGAALDVRIAVDSKATLSTLDRDRRQLADAIGSAGGTLDLSYAPSAPQPTPSSPQSQPQGGAGDRASAGADQAGQGERGRQRDTGSSSAETTHDGSRAAASHPTADRRDGSLYL